MRIAVALLLLAVAYGALPMTSTRSARASDFSSKLDQRWDFAKPDVSEQRFRQALGQYPANSREALEIATQIARAQGLQRQFDAAHATLDAIETKLPAAPTRVRIRYLLERGRLLNSSGAPERAVPMFREAADLATSDDPGDAFYRIDALHMLGLTSEKDERFDWNRRALEVAEAATDARARGWRASLYHNIGWTYFDRGEPSIALAYWEKALVARQAAKEPTRTRIAQWTVARGLRELGRLDEAEKIQRTLAAEYERIGETDGFVFEELAEIEMARGRRERARPWAAKAFAVLRDDAWFVATEPARLRRLAELGSATP